MKLPAVILHSYYGPQKRPSVRSKTPRKGEAQCNASFVFLSAEVPHWRRSPRNTLAPQKSKSRSGICRSPGGSHLKPIESRHHSESHCWRHLRITVTGAANNAVSMCQQINGGSWNCYSRGTTDLNGAAVFTGQAGIVGED